MKLFQETALVFLLLSLIWVQIKALGNNLAGSECNNWWPSIQVTHHVFILNPFLLPETFNTFYSKIWNNLTILEMKISKNVHCFTKHYAKFSIFFTVFELWEMAGWCFANVLQKNLFKDTKMSFLVLLVIALSTYLWRVNRFSNSWFSSTYLSTSNARF